MNVVFPEWFDGKNIDEVRFCRKFVKDRPLKCIGGRFYGIDGEISSGDIMHDISEMVMEYITSGVFRRVSSLFEVLKLYCYSDPLPVREDEIHLLNGMLKTDGTWLPEKQFCINRLNVTYAPEMMNREHNPTHFLSFLNELLDTEDIYTLQEYLGYCMIPSTKGQAMLFIIGNGKEGKSRIGKILKNILGEALIGGSFQRIETDKFFRYNLKDKLVMLDDDMQLSALPSTGFIKNLVTAEIPVDVEAKGQQSEQAMLYSRILCFGNSFPRALYDKSDGFARRLLILTTKPLPPDRVKDPYIDDKFIAEKNKIFCWIFEGLQRLIRNNYNFTVSAKTKRNTAEAMADNCNIIEFLSDTDYILFGEDYQTSSTELYGGYVHWCTSNGLTPLKQETFTGWLKSNEGKYHIKYVYHIPKKNGGHVRGFRGIKCRYVPFAV